MKRLLSSLLVAILTLALCAPALAAEPEAALFKVEKQTVRGNSAWTPESVPEVWLTPYFDEYIVEGKENYPAEFVRFPVAEGSSPYSFRQDSFGAVNFDTLVSYSYQAYDRASYELFLEKAEADNILADGSDGVAMYIAPDNRRGRAMIDVKSMFGGTAKLTIDVYDNTGDLDGEALTKLIQDETKRVQDAMKHEKLEQYWSKGAFSTVILFDDYAKHEVTLDVKDLTIIDLDDDKMIVMEKNSKGKVDKTKYELTDYLYHEEEAKDAALADGTPYKVYNSEYTGYTSFQLAEGEKPLILSIEITCDQEEFVAKLEQAYARVMADTVK